MPVIVDLVAPIDASLLLGLDISPRLNLWVRLAASPDLGGVAWLTETGSNSVVVPVIVDLIARIDASPLLGLVISPGLDFIPWSVDAVNVELEPVTFVMEVVPGRPLSLIFRTTDNLMAALVGDPVGLGIWITVSLWLALIDSLEVNVALPSMEVTMGDFLNLLRFFVFGPILSIKGSKELEARTVPTVWLEFKVPNKVDLVFPRTDVTDKGLVKRCGCDAKDMGFVILVATMDLGDVYNASTWLGSDATLALDFTTSFTETALGDLVKTWPENIDSRLVIPSTDSFVENPVTRLTRRDRAELKCSSTVWRECMELAFMGGIGKGDVFWNVIESVFTIVGVVRLEA